MSKRIVILAVGGMMEDAVRRLNYTGVAIFRCGKHGNGVAHKTTMACLRERTDFMKKQEVCLKPCPFCGGEAKSFTAFGTQVECTKCGAKVYDFEDNIAFAKWNARTKGLIL